MTGTLCTQPVLKYYLINNYLEFCRKNSVIIFVSDCCHDLNDSICVNKFIDVNIGNIVSANNKN